MTAGQEHATASGPGHAPPGARARTWLLDALALLALALLVRLPHLQRVPRFTDEVKEIAWALDIVDGRHLPLAAHNGYAGPIWNYLLAGLVVAFGPSPELPRLAMAAVGALTVVATYALARGMAGRAAGVVAGLLLAVSTVPILLSSHVAWSVCLTPLLAVLAAGACWAAVERGRGPLLVVAALLVAATAQAHPLGVLLAPALALWTLWRPAGRAMMRGPWPWIALGAAAIGYANMIAYHAASRMETVTKALEKLSDGVPGQATAAGYAAAAGDLAVNVGEVLVGQANRTLWPHPSQAGDVALAALLAAAASLACAAWRGRSLPLFVVATTVVLMPLANTQYSYPLGARYVSFLLPFLYTAVGVSAADVFARLRARGRPWALAAVLAVVALLGAHMALHARVVADTVRAVESAGRTNDLVLAMAARAAEEQASAGVGVLLDELIPAKFSGGGHLHRVLAALLRLSETDFELIEEDLDGADAQMAACGDGCLLLLSDSHAAALGARHRLERLELGPPPPAEDGEGYAMYRLRLP